MFNALSERFSAIVKNLRGQGRLTEANINDTLRDIRMNLLEADVALPVAKAFIEDIQEKALGAEVMQSLTPGQALIKIVYDELVHIMGDYNETLDLKTQPPAIILMAGLQGSGKTTTVAKLAHWLHADQKKSVLVASADVYRPAAIEQLETLAKVADVHFYPSAPNQNPLDIARGAVQAAKNQVIDVVIIDTAGRLHIDDVMMAEIKALHQALNPIETLFVVDSMTGQDAANTAKAFHEAIPITGVVLTKADGDARGGAALSVRHITGKPIKFVGISEKIDGLQPFYPDRMADRILDRGDVLTLIEDAERRLDKNKAEQFAKKIKSGKVFDLEDFRSQLDEIQKMGGMMGIMSKLPGMGQVPAQVKNQMDDKNLKRIKAILDSMTKKEKRYPDNIRNSQKRRIAMGSGTSIQAVNQVLKQFDMMRKTMRQMSKAGGLTKLMRGLQGKLPFGGKMPPGGFPFANG